MNLKIFIPLLIPLFFSCIKDSSSDCPYQYNVILTVKDKNYTNAESLGIDMISEDLPFREYVGNIYYTLQNKTTGVDVIEPQFIEVSGKEKEVNLTFDKIPDGDYILMVWGNIEYVKSPDIRPEMLHGNKEERTDEYLAFTELKIVTGIAKDMTLELQRTKGKLWITFNNLPEVITQIKESISDITMKVDEHLVYSENTDVQKAFLRINQKLDILTTCLAPTVQSKKSVLGLSLYDVNNNLILDIPQMNIVIKRNELTILEINYNIPENIWEIWVYINDQWTLINKLEINPE